MLEIRSPETLERRVKLDATWKGVCKEACKSIAPVQHRMSCRTRGRTGTVSQERRKKKPMDQKVNSAPQLKRRRRLSKAAA